MEKVEKIVNICILIFLLILIASIIYVCIEPYLYNNNTTGKKINDNNVFLVSDIIMKKKLEFILHENPKNIASFYPYQKKGVIDTDTFNNNISFYKENLNDYVVDKIERKSDDIFIVYYNLYDFDDKFLSSEKMIIKRLENDISGIIYDSMFEVDKNENA